MKTIYKYTLESKDEQIVEIKGLTKLLSVVEQYGHIVLYALVDTEEDKIDKVEIAIRGTGHNADLIFSSVCDFIGTVKLDRGNLMFHIFHINKR